MDKTDILDVLSVQVVNNADFAGNNAFEVVKPYDAACLLYDPLDPLVTLDLVNATIQAEYNVGLYFVLPPTGNGYDIANKWSKAIDDLGGLRKIKLVEIDCEKVPLTIQRAFVARWDYLRPFRPTIYCVEPYQDLSQNDYKSMLARNSVARVRKIAVQTYFGGMQPQRMRSVIDYVAAIGVNYNDLMVCTDPQQDSKYLSQVMTTGTKGGLLFEAGRIPR